MRLLIVSTHSHACTIINGNESGDLSSAGSWNVVRFQFNPQTGQHDPIAAWFDPAASSYTPQGGEIVVMDENNNYELIIIDASGDDSGGGGGGGGGNPPPGAIHATDNLAVDGGSIADQQNWGSIACGGSGGVGDDIVDRVRSVFSGVIPSLPGWLFFDVVFNSGGGGGGSDGGGGSGGSSASAGMSIPPSPANQDRASCNDNVADRNISARADVAAFCAGNRRSCVGNTWPRATTVSVRYTNGASESWHVGLYTSAVLTQPVPGSMRGCD